MDKHWQKRFVELTKLVRSWSADTSTKVGSVIVGAGNTLVSTGYNGFPRGIHGDPEDYANRYKRPDKYLWTEHAERNAIYNAARLGVSVAGCSLFMMSTLAGPPCADCARAIVQSGIKNVFVEKKDLIKDNWRPDWVDSMLIAMAILEEGNVGLYACDA